MFSTKKDKKDDEPTRGRGRIPAAIGGTAAALALTVALSGDPANKVDASKLDYGTKSAEDKKDIQSSGSFIELKDGKIAQLPVDPNIEVSNLPEGATGLIPPLVEEAGSVVVSGEVTNDPSRVEGGQPLTDAQLATAQVQNLGEQQQDR